MPFALVELAEMARGKVRGDPQAVIRAVRGLDTAGPGDLTFLFDVRRRDALAACAATAVLTAEGADIPPGMSAIIVDDPEAAVIPITAALHPVPAFPIGVHPAAAVDKTAQVGPGAVLRPGVVVEAGARVGARTVLHAGVVIGCRATVGADCVLYPNVAVYYDCVIGDRVVIHANAAIGPDGFGYIQRGGGHVKVPQVGNVVIEDDVEVGACSVINRARLGSTVIGRGSKLDHQVFVAHNVRMGQACLMIGQSGVAGSTTLGNGVILAGQAGVSGHLKVGDGAQIGGGSKVGTDVPPGARMIGYPAQHWADWTRTQHFLKKLPDIIKRLEAIENKQ
jgi:UDP-3-O-[3-hydroxymyristoyl] glucosamine N-acyltransferase